MATLDELRAELEQLTSPISRALVAWRIKFLERARPKQIIEFPEGYSTIFAHPGRGWGKNFTGVNWICWELALNPGRFGHVVAPTHSDVRFTCFEGESGVLAWVPDPLIAAYNASDLVLEFKNGSVLRGFSAEKPDRLRGPQCHYLWSDELAAWLRMRETYDQALLGCRLGTRSLHLITSTPQPKDLIRELIKDPRVLKIAGHQKENTANLSTSYLERNARLEGTRLGRQELAGNLLDAEELGIVQRSQWKVWPHDKPLPAFEIIVMSLDTAFSEENVDVKEQLRSSGERGADYTGCTVWGGWREKSPIEGVKPKPYIILLDAWQERLGFPELVAKVTRERLLRYGDAESVFKPVIGMASPTQGRSPDLLLIEDKASGISLRQTLRTEGIPVMPYDPADQNKLLRLNLVAMLYTQGYIWAVQSPLRRGEFKDWAEPVIAQMCSYTGEGSIEHDDLMDSATQALLWLMRNWLRQEPPVYTRRGIIRTPEGANPYAS